MSDIRERYMKSGWMPLALTGILILLMVGLLLLPGVVVDGVLSFGNEWSWLWAILYAIVSGLLLIFVFLVPVVGIAQTFRKMYVVGLVNLVGGGLLLFCLFLLAFVA